MKFITNILFLAIVFCYSTAYSQDTVKKPIIKAIATDTIPYVKQYPDPGHVALESALLPGLGQITNGQWYIAPILYAGLGTMIYFIHWNEQQFLQNRQIYTKLLNGDTAKLFGYIVYPYESDQVESYISYYRSNRDELIIGCVAVYVANILHAYVFAHLRSYDISNDLSLNIEPINFSNIANRNVLTCSLKFNFK